MPLHTAERDELLRLQLRDPRTRAARAAILNTRTVFGVQLAGYLALVPPNVARAVDALNAAIDQWGTDETSALSS